MFELYFEIKNWINSCIINLKKINKIFHWKSIRKENLDNRWRNIATPPLEEGLSWPAFIHCSCFACFSLLRGPIRCRAVVTCSLWFASHQSEDKKQRRLKTEKTSGGKVLGSDRWKNLLFSTLQLAK